MSKQTLSRLTDDVISLAYEGLCQPCPSAVRVHSALSMAASKAFLSGISLSDICNSEGGLLPAPIPDFNQLDIDPSLEFSFLVP